MKSLNRESRIAFYISFCFFIVSTFIFLFYGIEFFAINTIDSENYYSSLALNPQGNIIYDPIWIFMFVCYAMGFVFLLYFLNVPSPTEVFKSLYKDAKIKYREGKNITRDFFNKKP